MRANALYSPLVICSEIPCWNEELNCFLFLVFPIQEVNNTNGYGHPLWHAMGSESCLDGHDLRWLTPTASVGHHTFWTLYPNLYVLICFQQDFHLVIVLQITFSLALISLLLHFSQLYEYQTVNVTLSPWMFSSHGIYTCGLLYSNFRLFGCAKVS